MKIEKINLDGKKDSIEVLDKVFSAKINKKLVSNVIYKRCFKLTPMTEIMFLDLRFLYARHQMDT